MQNIKINRKPYKTKIKFKNQINCRLFSVKIDV